MEIRINNIESEGGKQEIKATLMYLLKSSMQTPIDNGQFA